MGLCWLVIFWDRSPWFLDMSWHNYMPRFWHLTFLDYQIDFLGGPKHFQESVSGHFKTLWGQHNDFLKLAKKLHPYSKGNKGKFHCIFFQSDSNPELYYPTNNFGLDWNCWEGRFWLCAFRKCHWLYFTWKPKPNFGHFRGGGGWLFQTKSWNSGKGSDKNITMISFWSGSRASRYWP